MKTAIEWLVKSLSDRMYIHCPDFGHTIIDKLVEQAKEMHNNEMINFAEWYHASKDENKLSNGRFTNKEIIKQYYSEIFKKD